MARGSDPRRPVRRDARGAATARRVRARLTSRELLPAGPGTPRTRRRHEPGRLAVSGRDRRRLTALTREVHGHASTHLPSTQASSKWQGLGSLGGGGGGHVTDSQCWPRHPCTHARYSVPYACTSDGSWQHGLRASGRVLPMHSAAERHARAPGAPALVKNPSPSERSSSLADSPVSVEPVAVSSARGHAAKRLVRIRRRTTLAKVSARNAPVQALRRRRSRRRAHRAGRCREPGACRHGARPRPPWIRRVAAW